MAPRRRALAGFAALGLGVLAVVAAMAAGRADLLSVVFEPPPFARFLLGIAAAIVGVVLLLRSTDHMGSHDDPRELVRAVRVAFLAVGAFAAAAGWLLGSPVPIVAALVIAGVDVVETSFLLLVTAGR
jgi:CHASE2 domain-containing sensor protein